MQPAPSRPSRIPHPRPPGLPPFDAAPLVLTAAVLCLLFCAHPGAAQVGRALESLPDSLFQLPAAGPFLSTAGPSAERPPAPWPLSRTPGLSLLESRPPAPAPGFVGRAWEWALAERRSEALFESLHRMLAPDRHGYRRPYA
ncbi:MAG: hypothetical protein GF355_12600, partial [Candidatus Eisenbacteria bacterium]|nr:hypothetical protein [Candidatus Eisenbacteria bacterium]